MEKLLKEEELDGEWVELMMVAKSYGMTPKQVRIFLVEKKELIEERVIEDQ